MSQRDRFHQSLSLARQQVLDSVYLQRDALTGRFGQGGSGTGQSSGHSNGNAANASANATAPDHNASAADLRRNGTLPVYSSQNTGPRVPAQALNAAPGASQAQIDALRQQIGRRPSANSSRPNASLAPGQASEPKTVHTYRGAGGRAVVELHTPPQRTPTYMGGSAERGRGAMIGRFSFSPKQGEKVSHITLKVKAVAHVRVPLINTNPTGPAHIAGRSPRLEQTTDRELLLLQLEQTLYQASAGNKDKVFEMPPQAAHDATVSWPFRFDIPGEDRGGRSFPASYVLGADPEAQPPRRTHASESTGLHLMSAGKGLLKTLKNAGLAEADANEWANVKWYLKVTIGRPSRLEPNERIFVPFMYLPPPPPKAYALLDRRARTSAQLRQNTPFGQLMENSSTWQEIGIGAAQVKTAGGEKSGGLFGGMLGLGGKNKKVETDWTIEMPSQPALYTLQGSIPFNLCTKSEKNLGSPLVSTFRSVGLSGFTLSRASGLTFLTVLPLLFPRQTVSLFKRVTLVAKSSQAQDVRRVCVARIATAPVTMRSAKTGVTTYRWQGVLDIPATCGPCFDSAILSLEYFIGIQQRADLPYMHAESIVLMCPPPRVMDTGTSAPQQPPAPAAGVMLQDAPVRPTGDQKVSAADSEKPPLPTRTGEGRSSVLPSSQAGPSAAGASTSAAPPPTTASNAHAAEHVTAANAAAADLQSNSYFDELDVAGMQVDLPPCESSSNNRNALQVFKETDMLSLTQHTLRRRAFGTRTDRGAVFSLHSSILCHFA